MGMERHEVPTVFVRGGAAPDAVRDVEASLVAALARTRRVTYSVLWIEADTPGEIAVEIEVGTTAGPVGARAEGSALRATGAACIAMLGERLDLDPLLVENGT
jgi:hypothetical protein